MLTFAHARVRDYSERKAPQQNHRLYTIYDKMYTDEKMLLPIFEAQSKYNNPGVDIGVARHQYLIIRKILIYKKFAKQIMSFPNL